MASLAAGVFSIATLAAVAFQLALAAGVPWGEYALGGRYPGQLPPAMRVAAVVQALVLAFLTVVVLTRARLVVSPFDASWLIWVVIAFATVSLILNTISRSPGERRIWVPVAAVMLASSVLVAIGT